MGELIKRMTEEAGINKDQAEAVLSVIADFLKEKYPLLKGNIDSILGRKPAAHS